MPIYMPSGSFMPAKGSGRDQSEADTQIARPQSEPKMQRPTRSNPCLFIALILFFPLAGPLSAETQSPPEPALSAEELARERQLLMETLQQARAPARDITAEIDVVGASSLGSTRAPLVLIELGDYQCTFCRRHLQMVMPDLLAQYVESDKVRYVFLDFPVEKAHPQAVPAANASRCAGDQGYYWEMRQRLYGHPLELNPAGFSAHAATLGLDQASFDRCVEQNIHEEAIRANKAIGLELLVRGTPTFFLGYPVGDGSRVSLVRRINGAQPLDVFQREIDGALAKVP
jgi:protein-disulfide isomerase